jgi:hypothetical protein
VCVGGGEEEGGAKLGQQCTVTYVACAYLPFALERTRVGRMSAYACGGLINRVNRGYMGYTGVHVFGPLSHYRDVIVHAKLWRIRAYPR